MSDLTAMSTPDAIRIVARWALWKAYEMWKEREDLWENVYPDCSEYDVQEIIKCMEKLLPMDVTLETYQVAYKVLACRAEKQEEV